jgi:hypothetical protein
MAAADENADQKGTLDELSKLIDGICARYEDSNGMDRLEEVLATCESTVPVCREVTERILKEVSGLFSSLIYAFWIVNCIDVAFPAAVKRENAELSAAVAELREETTVTLRKSISTHQDTARYVPLVCV